jgi:hypothetical protein
MKKHLLICMLTAMFSMGSASVFAGQDLKDLPQWDGVCDGALQKLGLCEMSPTMPSKE